MPRTKNLSHYPARYSELLRECGTLGQRAEVLFDDQRRANSLRGHWFAFIGALKHEARNILRDLPPGKMPSPGEDDILMLTKLAPTVMVTVEARDSGFAVVWQNRERSWQAMALREAIVTTPAPLETTKQLDDIASRLMRVQQQENNDGKDK